MERRFCLFFYSLKTPRVVSSAQNISQVSHSHTICNFQPPTLQSQSYSGLSVIKSGFLPWSSIKDKNQLIYVNIWVGRSLFITIQTGGEIRTKFHIHCYAHRVASVLVKDLLWSPICHKDTANSFFYVFPPPVKTSSCSGPVWLPSVETVKTVIISFNLILHQLSSRAHISLCSLSTFTVTSNNKRNYILSQYKP